MNKIDKYYNEFFPILLKGDRRGCTQQVMNILENGISIKEIYLGIFQRSLTDIGTMWQKNHITVADEHLCTAIIQSIIMSLYKNILCDQTVNKNVLITCIGNELHEVGARMVADFFEMEGWDVTYLGANVPARDIMYTISKKQTDLLGISCTMSKHIEYVKELILLCREKHPNLKIAVGGYCFNTNRQMVKYVGADIWSQDAQGTIQLAKELLLENERNTNSNV